MVTSIEKLVYQGVLLVGEPRLGIPFLLIFHARGNPTIMVRMFIKLDNPFDACEFMEIIFITLDGTPGAGEGIVVLINYNTPAGAVSGISCPMGIPPKPLDIVVVSIISARGDHC